MNAILPTDSLPPPEFLDPGEARRLIQTIQNQGAGGIVAQLVAARRGDGTSCLARDLFLVAAAWQGCRVLLLDLNPAGPTQADWMRARGLPMADMLLDREFAFIGSEASGAAVCEFRDVHPMQLRLWSKVLPKLRETFDLVLVDSPAIALSHDAVTVAPMVDVTLLVVAAEDTPKALVRNLRDRIFDAGGVVGGVILNKRREHTPPLLRRFI